LINIVGSTREVYNNGQWSEWCKVQVVFIKPRGSDDGTLLKSRMRTACGNGGRRVFLCPLTILSVNLDSTDLFYSVPFKL